jgi:hypothetical protein
VDEDATTHWTQWRFVEIERSIEVFPSQNFVLSDNWKRSLRVSLACAEASPTGKSRKEKSWVYVGLDGDEMILEGLYYCAFRSIVASMHVRGNELEFGVPWEGDCLFKRGIGFVVHYLEVH